MPLRSALLRLGAACAFACIIWVNSVFWAAAYLGFQAQPDSGVIVALIPEGAAEQAGARLGDRIRTLYNLPWQELLTQSSNVTRIFSPQRTVPMTVERDGQILTFALSKTHHEPGFQREKLGMLVLALLCWLTGAMFIGVRRNTGSWSALVSGFWLALSVVIGAYLFARYTFPLLHVALHVIVFALVPLCIYAHTYYPSRLASGAARIQARRALLLSYAVLALFLLWGVQRYGFALLRWQTLLGASVWLALIIAFIGNSVFLWQRYQNEPVEPIRRQIRLIFYAVILCSIVFCGFYLLTHIGNTTMNIAEPQLALVFGVVPLAYLVGYAVADAYQFEQVFAWLLHHAFSVLIALSSLLVVSRFAGWIPTPSAWFVIGFVLCYRVAYVTLRFFSSRYIRPSVATTLRAAAEQLTTTLDQKQLLTTIAEGLGNAYFHPPLAIYTRQEQDASSLTLRIVQHFAHLPSTIDSPTLLAAFGANEGRVTTAAAFVQQVDVASVAPEAHQLVRHPNLALLCPILDTQHTLFGIIAIGLRPNLDAYRPTDMLYLQQFMGAASLALANSVTYQRQRQAEATVRSLYQRLQQAQDVVLRDLAIEIHDEVINIGVRLNIEALEQCIELTSDTQLRQKLQVILQTEQATATTLRMVCEDIYPTGLDDPLGLASVLRVQIERIQLFWDGACYFRVENVPFPVHPNVQREAVRITREALTNAVKHAQHATTITMRLRFLADPPACIIISICDNGQTATGPHAQPAHFGLRNMEECARSVGGSVQIALVTSGGLVVECKLPAIPIPSQEVSV